MLEEWTHDADNTEIENMGVAADLLRRMLLELQSLEVNNPRLRFSMSSTGYAIRQRLDLLSGIIESLRVAQAPVRARELHGRARALIRKLAGELEQIALEAEHDLEGIT